MSFKERYKNEIDGLSFSDDYEMRIREAIKKAERKNSFSFNGKRKLLFLAAAVITVSTLLSVITVAEPSSHTPDATTEQFQISVTDFEDRWKKSKRFPYESGDEQYAFTVLGITSGDFLNNCEGFSADEGKDYFVAAIRSTESRQLSLEDGSFTLKVTPLIYGREPWETNSTTLCSDTRLTEKKGVIYYLFDTAFLEGFAGRTVCLAAYEGDTPSNKIFSLNEKGIISFSEDYKGFGKIFELPSDMSGTHPEAAEEMLSEDVLSSLI